MRLVRQFVGARRYPLAVAFGSAVVAASWWSGHVWPLYGLLALTTLAVSWRVETVQAVGWALFASWMLSNAAHWWIAPADQPQAYTVCEAAVLSMAFFSHVLGAPRTMIVLVALSMLSICLNFYVSSLEALTDEQRYLWKVVSNGIFAAENVLVIVPMLHDRVRRSHRRAGVGSLLSAFHGSASSSEATKR